MGTVQTIYTDGKKHKHDTFKIREERDAVAKQLRLEGWLVKCNSFKVEGETYYEYEAKK